MSSMKGVCAGLQLVLLCSLLGSSRSLRASSAPDHIRYVQRGGSNFPSCGAIDAPCFDILPAINWANVQSDESIEIRILESDPPLSCALASHPSTIDVNVTLRGWPGVTALDCEWRGGLSRLTQLTLQNLHFSRCGKPDGTQVCAKNVALTNITVDGCVDKCFETEGEVKNVAMSNVVGSPFSVKIADPPFSLVFDGLNTTQNVTGPLIYSGLTGQPSTITITNSNLSLQGTEIITRTSITLSIFNSTLTNVTMVDFTEKIIVQDSVFQDSNSIQIRGQNSFTSSIERTIFRRVASAHSLVYLSYIRVEDCIFEDIAGRALYANGPAPDPVRRCTFRNVSRPIECYAGGTATVDSCDFRDSHGLREDYIVGQGELTLRNSVIRDISFATEASAISLRTNTQKLLANVTLINCTSPFSRAAMYVEEAGLFQDTSIQGSGIVDGPAALVMEFDFVNAMGNYTAANQSLSLQCNPGSEPALSTVANLAVSCRRCSEGSYSASGGLFVLHSMNSPTSCQPCPANLRCAGGDNVFVSAGYYAVQSGFTFDAVRCLPGRCCAQPGGCPVQNQCNPNMKGIFCSECEPGYSLTLDGQNCVPDSSCNNQWYFAVVALFSFGFAWYIVVSKKLKSSATMVAQLLHTYQIMKQSYVALSADDAGEWTDRAFSLFSFSFSPNVCAQAGMSATDIVIVELFMPGMVAVSMIAIYVATVASHKWRKKDASKVQEMFASKFVWMLLYTYTSVLAVCVSLLTCVSTPAGSRMLYNGSVECLASWQQWVVLALILVVSVPLFFLYMLYRAHKAKSSGKSSRISEYFAQGYTDRMWYWEGLLLFQRVVVVILGNVLPTKTIAVSLMAILENCVLILTVAKRPFVDTLLQSSSGLFGCGALAYMIVNVARAPLSDFSVVATQDVKDFLGSVLSVVSSLVLVALSLAFSQRFRERFAARREKKAAKKKAKTDKDKAKLHLALGEFPRNSVSPTGRSSMSAQSLLSGGSSPHANSFREDSATNGEATDLAKSPSERSMSSDGLSPAERRV